MHSANKDCSAFCDMPVFVELVEQTVTTFSEFQQMSDAFEQLILYDGL